MQVASIQVQYSICQADERDIKGTMPNRSLATLSGHGPFEKIRTICQLYVQHRGAEFTQMMSVFFKNVDAISCNADVELNSQSQI